MADIDVVLQYSIQTVQLLKNFTKTETIFTCKIGSKDCNWYNTYSRYPSGLGSFTMKNFPVYCVHLHHFIILDCVKHAPRWYIFLVVVLLGSRAIPYWFQFLPTLGIKKQYITEQKQNWIPAHGFVLDQPTFVRKFTSCIKQNLVKHR